MEKNGEVRGTCVYVCPLWNMFKDGFTEKVTIEQRPVGQERVALADIWGPIPVPWPWAGSEHWRGCVGHGGLQGRKSNLSYMEGLGSTSHDPHASA